MNGRMVLLDLVRGQVVEARMRPHRVVASAPGFDDDLRFATAAKPLDAQTLVTKLAGKRFVRAVLPRLSRVDDGGLDAGVGQPLQDGVAHEFRTAVGAQVNRGP